MADGQLRGLAPADCAPARPCDRALLWQLCVQHRPQWIGQLLRWGVRSTEDAEEILGDVTVKISELVDARIAAIRNPEAWLTRLLRHRCIDLSRRRRRHAELLALLRRRGSRNDEHPEAMLGSEELRRLAEAALLALPSAQRQVFLARTTAGSSYLQIAATQACSVAGARKRYQYARDRIAHALERGGL